MGHGPATVVQRGFTLLELLVVLLIVALAAGLTAPALGRSLDAIRVRAEVAGFAALLRHAREQAITSRTPHVVDVDVAEGEARVLAEDTLKRTRALPAQWTIEVAGPSPMRFEPQGTSTGGAYRIVAGAVAFQVTVDPLTGRVRSIRE